MGRRSGRWSERRRPPRAYRLYGLSVRSPWPLHAPGGTHGNLGRVELAKAARLSRAVRDGTGSPGTSRWFHHARLRDGSDYLRWSGLFEFVVSPDGSRIACHPLNGTSPEAFRTYLLGQVLSFALIRQGIEPLHATVVVIEGDAVGFLGDCGYGKSSLGAAFLQAGHRLLTDDLLVVGETGRGVYAYPGPPRIKLFPQVARRLFGEGIGGTPINPLTPKLVIPLERDGMFWERPAPLKAIYVLAPPSRRVRSLRIGIRSLSPRQAFVELLRNTFNTVIADPARLRRQFELATRLASGVSLKSLSFPRRLADLPTVREAIQLDLMA